jgi:hypothetical protein
MEVPAYLRKLLLSYVNIGVGRARKMENWRCPRMHPPCPILLEMLFVAASFQHGREDSEAYKRKGAVCSVNFDHTAHSKQCQLHTSPCPA